MRSKHALCLALAGTALLAPSLRAQEEAVLIRLIETSEFSPPSPDPAGIVYLPASGELLISDSEVNEMAIYAGVNLFTVSIAGNLVGGANTLAFSDEPTGLGHNPLNGHLFVSDDDADRIFEVDPGDDGAYGTGDDTVTYFDTDVFGCTDAEDVAYDPTQNELFILDGFHNSVFRLSAGANGDFDGVPPAGDDSVVQMDVSVHGLGDPEGIGFSAGSGTLFIMDSDGPLIVEMTTSGGFVRSISTDVSGPKSAAGICVGPSSVAPGELSLYVVRRGVDNDSDPTENDGRLFELSVSGLVTVGNLPPSVSAGSDATVGIEGGAVLDGSVGDDGLPDPPGALTIGWTKLSGPGSVTFGDATQPATTADFSTTGQYVLRLSADDGEFTTVDHVTITVVAGGAVTVESRVETDDDDAEEDTFGDVYLGSSDLEMVTEDTLQTIGLRFTDVTVPQGATITSAHIQFQVDESDSEDTSLTLRGQDVDDAPTFTSADFDVSSRTPTSAGVVWPVPPWPTVGAAGPDQRTPDLATVIQEIVDRPGWSSGNSLAILITGSGKRVAEAYDGVPAAAPLLIVQYGGESPDNQAPSVSAGPDQTVGVDDQAALDGTVADDGLPDPPGAVTTTWSKVSGPGTVSFGDAAAVDTTATFSTPGTYVVRLTASDGEFSPSDDATITVTQPNDAPVVDAGPDLAIDHDGVATLDGTVSDDGQPDPPGAVTTTWSKLSGPGTVTFADAGAIDTTATFSTPGAYVVRLSAFDGLATSTDDATVTVIPPNAAPVVSAGPDLFVELGDGATLDGTVGDDGLPDPPGVVTTTWSQVSGPGPVGFADAGAVDTTATFEALGTYVVRLSAFDGEFTSVDDATITVTPPNTPPVVDAGPDLLIVLGESGVLDATVSDDGIPDPPGALTTTWSKVSGPGNPIFGDASAVDTTVRYTKTGVFVVRLTADDGAASTSDDVTITVVAGNTPPSVSITTPSGDVIVTEGDAVSLGATASDAEDGDLSASVTWSSSLSGPLGGGAGISPVLPVGVHTVTASVTDSGGLGDSASVQVQVLPAGAILLTATAHKVKGVITVDLDWVGADGAQVTVLRDGVPIATTANDGAYTDSTGQKGKVSFTYQVCETGGGECSNLVTAGF